MSEIINRAFCRHGKLEGECETCAAWEGAIYNQRRAEKAEKEVERLRERLELIRDRACGVHHEIYKMCTTALNLRDEWAESAWKERRKCKKS